MFYCEFYEVFKKTCFIKHLWTSASDISNEVEIMLSKKQLKVYNKDMLLIPSAHNFGRLFQNLPKRHQNDVINAVLVSLLLTLNSDISIVEFKQGTVRWGVLSFTIV